jgi:hypothetical protein
MKFSDINILEFGNSIQLTGAIFSDDSKSYVCMFPDEEKNDDLNFISMDSEEWKALIRQTDLLETEILAKAPDGALVKIIYRKSQRQIDQVISWKVFRRDNYTCRYCGSNNVPLTVDHLVCWEEGGPSIESNLLAVDKKCNKTRGKLDYKQWLNHSYYKKVSKNLTEQQREANRLIVERLDQIPRVFHQRSR